MNIPDLGDLWPLERDALALLEGAVLFWPEEEERRRRRTCRRSPTPLDG
jgi:hypothetical protein